MKISKMGIKTSKTRANEGMASLDIAFQADMLKRYSAGVYGLGNLLTRAKENVIKIIREELNKVDCVEVSLPILQPKELWVESKRWDKYVEEGEMFHFEGKNGEYCIAPTAEEVMFSLVKNSLTSYKNLDVIVYQFGEKFRDEIRSRGGLLRCKQFCMKDAYSFAPTNEVMNVQYEKMRQAYIKIFNRMGIDIIPARAVNGSIGGKISEEFMLISDIGGDRMLYNEEANLAVNEEVLENEDAKADLIADFGEIDFTKFKEYKTIELGHIFKLEQNYSKKMNGKFTTKSGENDYYYMGCYGIGVTRTLNAIMEINADESGLCFPVEIAPYKIGIVNLYDEELNNVANDIYNSLQSANYEVLWNDIDMPFGQKIKDMELFGVPYIVILGKNYLTTGMVEIENRKTKEKVTINKDDLVKYFSFLK